MESKAPIKIHIVKKTVFSVPDKGRASKTAATEWQVWPAIQVANPGDTFEWEIKDHQPHKLTIHLPGEFEPPSIETTGHKATARLVTAAGKAQHVEYEVYVDDVFAHGLSAPGIIIE
jgi:hypothetical protein